MSPVKAEPAVVLADHERTHVCRVRQPGSGGTAIRKRAIGSHAEGRIRHERAILRRLSGLAGVPHLIGGDDDPFELLTDDAGGTSLAGTVLPARELPTVALQLAGVLAAVHQAGVIHRDVNPSNVVRTADGRILLIDFDVATTFAELRPAFTHHREIVGSLPYMAPEQTGRTAQAVDQRCDLYGLGAALYELATGRPPFGDGDALELIRDILTTAPAPLAELTPDLPPGFAAVVMRLLEKEPDRRYQSAAGLIHDLEFVAAGRGAGLRLGRHDFPDRLVAPSVLVGRDDEIAVLRRALDGTATSAVRGVLIAGSGGVGKSALIGQLAPMVTARQGWFVRAKHDQFRPDIALSGMMQALRGLCRFLLAEPDDQLAEHRDRLVRQLGPNAGLAADLLPELAALIGTGAGPGELDPARATARVRRIALDVLRAVASPDRPIVLVLDDLQWAGGPALQLADVVLTDPELRGVLVVGAYRDSEVDAAHPLAAMRDRWQRLGALAADLHLASLGRPQQRALLAEMLRLADSDAGRLADLLAERCDGNPYETVELVNALRRDGALSLTSDGWRWRDADIRGHVGSGDVIDLLAARLDRFPPATRDHLRVMACLGTEVGVELLATAAGREPARLWAELVPALEDGLLIGDEDGAAVRFRHDRVQQAAYDDGCRLGVARRLAPRFRGEAAEQYRHVLDELTEPAERDTAAGLFDSAAAEAMRVADYASAEGFLADAIRLHGATFPRQLARHVALYNLGRLDEADDAYAWLAEHGGDPAALVGPAGVQMASLTIRLRPRDAVALGVEMLGRLGFPRPDDLPADVERGMDGMSRWIAAAEVDRDATRPQLTDPVARAAARLFHGLASPAFFCDHDVMNWLTVEAHALWERYGPDASLVAPLAQAAHVWITLRGDHVTGSRIVRHVLAVAERRGYPLASAHARFFYAVAGRHWSEPLEGTPAEVAAAREGLLSGGDPQHATFTYLPLLSSGLEIGPTLDRLAADADAALALAARTGNETGKRRFLTYHGLIRVLRDGGEPDPGGPPPGTDEVTLVYVYNHQALAAAVFGDEDALAQASAAALALVPQLGGGYPSVLARLLRAVAADVTGDERAALERWFAGRATESPANFAHLHHFVRAENARARGDAPAALQAFDAGLSELDGRSRPWHRALMLERAVALHASMGLDRGARALLVEAHGAYEAWGATAKVRRLEDQHPFLRRRAERERPAGQRQTTLSFTADDIDMMAILRASQALSSVTSLPRLHAAAVEQLSTLTGADRVSLLLAGEDHDWQLLPEPGPFPATVVRYVDRTGEPLIVADAVRDDRFRDDLYLSTLERCALMAVPLTTQGAGRAMLVLENRLSAGAFAGDRLDAVMLIAGQLAVSVRNAVLYHTLEERVAERTAALREANDKLAVLSVTDELTGLPNRRRFTDVLDGTWTGVHTVAVAMIDIDHFKKFNDRYGHPAGDACLRRVAQAMSAVTRDPDIVCRYGGEEFVMVLPNAPADHALALGERIRRTVAELGIPHADNPDGVVTISVGMAAAATAGTSAAELLATADGALYEAKRDGRNRVRVAG